MIFCSFVGWVVLNCVSYVSCLQYDTFIHIMKTVFLLNVFNILNWGKLKFYYKKKEQKLQFALEVCVEISASFVAWVGLFSLFG